MPVLSATIFDAGLITTVWLPVRVLPAPPRTPMLTEISRGLTNTPRFCGAAGPACSLCKEEGPLQGQFGAFCLWRPKNRFRGGWEGAARDSVRMRQRPVSGHAGRARAPRRPRCEKGERDRHVDLPDAAFVARSDLLRTGDLAGDDRPHFEASCKLGNQFLTCGVPWYFSSKFLTIDAVVKWRGARPDEHGGQAAGRSLFLTARDGVGC